MPGLFRSGNWNENNLNFLLRINWRVSLVPAAVVILASIAYIKVVVVKKLVVGFVGGASVPTLSVGDVRLRPSLGGIRVALSCRAGDAHLLL